MKKSLSIILAMVLTLSTAVTSFALTNNDITLGLDADAGVTLEKALLTPGETYHFPITVGSVALTEDILDDYNFKIRPESKNNSIEDIKLSKMNDVYYLTVEVKDGYPATQSEVEYSLEISKKGSSSESAEKDVSFTTGHVIVDDAVIDALNEEDVIVIDNGAPVYEDNQLERIGKVNNYKHVTFEGTNWTYNVNVTDAANVNFSYNSDVISEVLEVVEDQNFEFINFPGKPSFKTNGMIEMDVSEMSESYKQNFFVYRYNDGKLSPVAASYDHEEDILSIQTRTLGNFAITDKEITDRVITPPSEDDAPDSDDNYNPNTGATA